MTDETMTAADRGDGFLSQLGLGEFLAPGPIAAFGDWHGDGEWGAKAVEMVAQQTGARLMLHVGDFGVWPGPKGEAYLTQISEALVRNDAAMLVTPGNHEDWDRLSQFWLGKPRQPLVLAERLVILPRGFRFHVGAWQIASLGGAPSVDFEFREPGVSWWPHEQVTAADVDRLIADGPVDILVTHDAPDGGTKAVDAVLRSNPFGFSERALAYAAEGRELMNRARDGVRPKLQLHGHYHVSDDTGPGPGRIIALDCERRVGNLVLVDLSGERGDEVPVG